MAENLTEEGWVNLSIGVPPELATLGIAPDLQRFFDAMIYKLRRNAHKGRWDTVPMERAMSALCGEVVELECAVVTGSTSEILMEAADVANQALIVAAIALEAKERALAPVKAGSPAIDGREDAELELASSDVITRRVASQPESESERARRLRA